MLIHNGKLYPEALRHEMTHHELMIALRAGGCLFIEEVRCAILEADGQILPSFSAILGRHGLKMSFESL